MLGLGRGIVVFHVFEFAIGGDAPYGIMLGLVGIGERGAAIRGDVPYGIVYPGYNVD
jgi:hypothetical protein